MGGHLPGTCGGPRLSDPGAASLDVCVAAEHVRLHGPRRVGRGALDREPVRRRRPAQELSVLLHGCVGAGVARPLGSPRTNHQGPRSQADCHQRVPDVRVCRRAVGKPQGAPRAGTRAGVRESPGLVGASRRWLARDENGRRTGVLQGNRRDDAPHRRRGLFVGRDHARRDDDRRPGVVDAPAIRRARPGHMVPADVLHRQARFSGTGNADRAARGPAAL